MSKKADVGGRLGGCVSGGGFGVEGVELVESISDCGGSGCRFGGGGAGVFGGIFTN